MRHLSLALALLVLAACGGGEAPVPSPPGTVSVGLGLVSATTATPLALPMRNDATEAAEVVEVAIEGPVALVPGQLPLALAAGEEATIAAAVTPTGGGSFEGSAVARVRSASGAETLWTVLITGEADPVVLVATPGTLEYGDVLPGTAENRAVTVRNESSVSVAHVTGLATAPHGFEVPELPLTLAAGESADVTLRYAPTRPGTPAGSVVLASDNDGGPLSVEVAATTGGEEIVDFGAQSFGTDGNTNLLTFDVPADAIGFLIEGLTQSDTVLGLRLLTGPGGEEFENLELSGPYIWRPGQGIFTAMVPNTDRAAVQLPPGGGTWSLRLFRWSGTAASVDVRVIVERRPAPGTDVIATIDLNVFLADAIAPTAATASQDATLQTVLDEIDSLLAQQGIRVGEISYYDVDDPTYDDVTSAEFGPLLTLSAAAEKIRLNLFFVRTAIGGGILGVSPTLGGPPRNGTQLSGVMSLYSTSNPAFIGLVATHEIGHFVGLAHTQEKNGSHDDIEDTDECPDCTGTGGGYLMHWQAVGGTAITDGQGLVIRGHPHMGPALLPPAGMRKPAAPKPFVGAFAPQDWCGTCNRLHPVKGR